MNRRAFLGSLLAFGAAGLAAASQPAQAATLFDELKALETAPDGQQAAANDLPAEGAKPAQYYRRRGYGYRPRRVVYRRPYYRPVYRRRVVCRTYVNRWGRLQRRCY